VPELVSGWNDDRSVYLVFRDGERVTYRQLPAKWSAWMRGLSADDKRVLQRDTKVVALRDEPGGYTRVDFKGRWERRQVIDHVGEHIRGLRLVNALSGDGRLDAAILEGDVNPLRRFLSDNPAVQIGTPRTVYVDIETDSRKPFVEVLAGKARVLCWAAAVLEADGTRRLVGSDVLEHDSDAAERVLLGHLFDLLCSYDCVLSWNGDAFDFEVLWERQKKMRVRLSNGRPPAEHRWCFLDHMEVFKKYNQAHESGEERSSFALDAIAQHVVGEGKKDFDPRRTWEAWEAGGDRRAELLSYCEQDTLLMPAIEAKTGFVALHLAVCQVTRCFPDSWSLRASAQGDGFLLALGAARGFRFPTRRFDDAEEEDPFKGAYVMEPKKLGVIEGVHVCDFAALYPSIMRSWNMSPDTLLQPHEVEGCAAKCKLPHTNTWFRTDRRGIFPEALDLLVAERAKYTKRADDAEPGSPEWDRFKRLSSAYKIVANSFYGIVGSNFTRYFNRDVAEGVTQAGAWLIKRVVAEATLAGCDPFYGDTDSVFATGEEAVFAGVVERMNASWPTTLTELGCERSYVKLEFEKSYRRLVLISAKRYAARYLRYKGKPAPPEMKPEIKGLEYKRGDTMRLAREMQKEAIDLLLDVSRAVPEPSELRALVARWRARLLEGQLSIEDVMISQSVKKLSEYSERYTSQKCSNRVGKKSCGYEFTSKAVRRPEKLRRRRDEEEQEAERDDGVERCPKCGAARKLAKLPAHVRVAKILEARGEEVVEGTRIEYLVVGRPEGDDESGMNAVPAHDPGMFEKIDRDYYWMQRVLPPTARLLDVIFPGYTWEETKATRNRERKALELAEKASRAKRGDVDDLPLFVQHGAAERRTT